MKPLVYLLSGWHVPLRELPRALHHQGRRAGPQSLRYGLAGHRNRQGVVDDHTIELVRKKDGRVTNTQKRTVSADGNSLTEETTDSTVAGVAPVTSKSHMEACRQGPGWLAPFFRILGCHG